VLVHRQSPTGGLMSQCSVQLSRGAQRHAVERLLLGKKQMP
jgi:hypothetical protein